VEAGTATGGAGRVTSVSGCRPLRRRAGWPVAGRGSDATVSAQNLQKVLEVVQRKDSPRAIFIKNGKKPRNKSLAVGSS
jgi:hypothetical protein